MAESTLAPNDIIAAGDFSISVLSDPKPVDGFPFTSTKISFQFPPRISSSSKKSNWQETDIRSYEPLVIWKGAGPTKYTLEATYIVTGSPNTDSNGSPSAYNAPGIAGIIRTLRAYFYRSMEEGTKIIPVVRFDKIYEFHGDGEKPFYRLEDLQVSHGETLMESDGFFPLVTKINMTLALVTQVGGIGGDAKQDFRGIPEIPRKIWY